MKYDEVTNQVLQHSRDNDDVIMECLNLFALMLNNGDNQDYGNLQETKMKLNAAFQEYENLLNILRLKNEYTFDYSFEVDDSAKVKYKELIDRNRDNIEA